MLEAGNIEQIDRLRAEANEHLTELPGTRTERNRLEAEHAQSVQSKWATQQQCRIPLYHWASVWS